MSTVRTHKMRTAGGKVTVRHRHDRAGEKASKRPQESGWSWTNSSLKPATAALGTSAFLAVTYSLSAVMSVTAAAMYGVTACALGMIGGHMAPKRKSRGGSRFGAAVRKRKRSAGRRVSELKSKYSPKQAARRARRKLGDKLFGRFRAWRQGQRERIWASVHRAQRASVIRDKSGKVVGLKQH